MIDFKKIPKKIDIVKNNVGAILEATNFKTSDGNFGTAFFQKTGTLAVGEVFLVPDFEEGQNFGITAVATPDDSGLQITAGADIETTASELRLNYVINRQFTIKVIGSNLYFTTKEKQAATMTYNASLDFGFSEALLTNYNLQSTTNGVASVYKNNFKIVIQLYIEEIYNSGNYISLELTGEADINGLFEFSLKILKSKFTQRDLPIVNQGITTLAINTMKRCFIKAAEYYDDKIKKLYETQIFYLLNGKINAADYPDFDLITHIQNTQSYLKSGLTEIKTTTEAQQYLYFLYPETVADVLKLSVKIYYTSGAVYTTLRSIYTTADDYNILIIPVGYTALALDSGTSGSGSGSGENIYKYEVSVINSADVQVGKTITYWVTEHNENDKIFLYENRFGVFDTLIATGDITREHIIESEVNRINLPIEYSKEDCEFIEENKNDYAEYKCNTGFFTTEYADEIEAMLAANYFYFIKDNNYIRCILLKSNKVISESDKNLYSVEFQYRYALV